MWFLVLMLTRSVKEFTICWPSSAGLQGGPVKMLFCKIFRLSICGSGEVFKAIKTLGLLYVVFKVVEGVGLALVVKSGPYCQA